MREPQGLMRPAANTAAIGRTSPARARAAVAATAVVAAVVVLTLAVFAPAAAAGARATRGTAHGVSYPTTDHPLLAVDFVSSSTGWVVGSHRVILRTTTGGAWWSRQSSVTGDSSYTDVAFADKLHGWVASASGILRRTVDAGAIWRAGGFGTAATRADRVDFVNPTTGWAIFGEGQDSGSLPTQTPLSYGVMKTVDGGQTWAMLTAGEGMSFAGVDFVDAGHGWIAGRADADSVYGSGLRTGLVMATADGGVTWSRLSLPAPLDAAGSQPSGLLAVDFTDARHGVITGWSGEIGSRHAVILVTGDGGTTWSLTTSSRFTRGTRVSMANAATGWVIGEGGGRRLLHTANGGRSWTAQLLPPRCVAADVDAVGPRTAFVCGSTSDGRHAMIAKTRDGGQHWTRVR